MLSARYRAELGRPLALEESLLRHPKCGCIHARRLAAHRRDAALLLYHPQVNVDVGIISWQLPRAEFHRYLRRFIDAGFGKRVMFGSDQLLFPEMIRVAIENIESAEFLTAEQKRDISTTTGAFPGWIRKSRADTPPEAPRFTTLSTFPQSSDPNQ